MQRNHQWIMGVLNTMLFGHEFDIPPCPRLGDGVGTSGTQHEDDDDADSDNDGYNDDGDDESEDEVV